MKISAPMPWPRRIAALAVAIESAIALAAGGYLAVASVVSPATERGAGVAEAVLALVLAAGLALLARAVLAGSARATVPVVVWQVLMSTIAVPALAENAPIGVGLLLLCVAGLGVLVPARRAASA